MTLDIDGWTRQLEKLGLVAGDPLREARNNTLVFRRSGAAGAGANASELAAFLGSCWRRYSTLAQREGLRGFFYCWFDAQSDTLRCSFSSAGSPDDLPFACELRLVLTVDNIAERAAEAGGHGIIPLANLADVPWADGDGEDDEVFILDVFAARLPGDFERRTLH